MKTTKYALAKAIGFVGLFIAVSLPTRAQTFFMGFQNTTGAPAPTSGGFTYGPVNGFPYFGAPAFSNFQVTWDGLTFDLTGSANGPETFGGDECNPFSSPGFGLAIMTQTVSGCKTTPTYEWFAFAGNPPIGASFAFGVITNGVGDSQRGGASIEIFSDPTGTPTIPNASASGTWTVTQVPEPPGALLLAAGLLALMGTKRMLRLA
jgi:hypothetical protein